MGTSQKRIQANHQYAAKSTGPRTDEGTRRLAKASGYSDEALRRLNESLQAKDLRRHPRIS